MQQRAVALKVARRSVIVPALFTSRRAIIRGVASDRIPRGMTPLAVQDSAEVVEKLAEVYVSMDMATMTAFHKKAMEKMLRTSDTSPEPVALHYEDHLLHAMYGGGAAFTSPPSAGAAPPATDGGAAGARGEPMASSGKKSPDKTTVDVALKQYPAANKVKLIKELRSICGLSIQEAKTAIEKCPGVIARQLSTADAEKLQSSMAKLEAEVVLV